MVSDEGGIIVVLGVGCRVDVGLLIAETAAECVFGPVVLIMLVSTVLCVAVLKAFELNGIITFDITKEYNSSVSVTGTVLLSDGDSLVKAGIARVKLFTISGSSREVVGCIECVVDRDFVVLPISA